MHTVWVRQGFGQYWKITNEAEKPDYQVDNLAELCKLLLKCNLTTHQLFFKTKNERVLYMTFVFDSPAVSTASSAATRSSAASRSPTCWRESGQQSADISLFPRLALCPPSSDALLLNPAVCAQCEDALDRCGWPPPKMKAASSSAWSSALAASRWTSSRCCKTARSPLICPAAGYGRLQSADPVTGYYREQERPGSPLRGWTPCWLRGAALLRLPLPSKRSAAAPAAPCEDRLSGGAGPLL